MKQEQIDKVKKLRGELDAAKTEITGLSQIAGIYERENIELRAALRRIAEADYLIRMRTLSYEEARKDGYIAYNKDTEYYWKSKDEKLNTDKDIKG